MEAFIRSRNLYERSKRHQLSLAGEKGGFIKGKTGAGRNWQQIGDKKLGGVTGRGPMVYKESTYNLQRILAQRFSHPD